MVVDKERVERPAVSELDGPLYLVELIVVDDVLEPDEGVPREEGVEAAILRGVPLVVNETLQPDVEGRLDCVVRIGDDVFRDSPPRRRPLG